MKVQNKFDFKKITVWAKDYTPEQLGAYLEPAYIKKQIGKTRNAANVEKSNFSNLSIEVMTGEEYKGKGGKLNISYSFGITRFGTVMIASTSKGVCYMGFADNGEEEAAGELKRRFPYAHYLEGEDDYQLNALSVFDNADGNKKPIRLHLKGTTFQLSIWRKLLQIPFGGLVSYASLAGDAKKSRAAGTAVGDNPVGFLVPCHRVVRSNPVLDRKSVV